MVETLVTVIAQGWPNPSFHTDVLRLAAPAFARG
jgi:hypothetical protein